MDWRMGNGCHNLNLGMISEQQEIVGWLGALLAEVDALKLLQAETTVENTGQAAAELDAVLLWSAGIS
jgi:hypothetical protein